MGLAISAGLAATTGVALVFLRYIMPSQDPFSAYPHPSWSWILMAHVFATPFFFFFVGGLWWHHALSHWRSGNPRLSGVLVVASIVLLGLSGYLLYFVGAEFWLQFWRVCHATVGVLGIAIYTLHMILGLRALARARNQLDPS
ncbi:MAG: hypothetical protein OEN01_02645 [Candidatus Krumholzibacteria bacterium]|nr:hypothetical protein [Candidatus Krumholzibacteria bacterium]